MYIYLIFKYFQIIIIQIALKLNSNHFCIFVKKSNKFVYVLLIMFLLLCYFTILNNSQINMFLYKQFLIT